MSDLSKIIPIYDISSDGCVISDNKASISFCFKLELPIIQTLAEEDYKNIVESFREFMELIGEDTIFHKQDFFFPEKYRNKPIADDFTEQSYGFHFDGRRLMKMESYLYISKVNSDKTDSILGSLVSKNFAQTDEKEFLNHILNSSEILRRQGIILHLLSREDLLNAETSPISTYYTLSNSKKEEIKDIDFKNGVKIGNNDVYYYSIDNLKQFGREDLTYCKDFNGLPISNMFDFSYKLACPHILNQVIYIPKKDMAIKELDTKKSKLESFNYKGSNLQAISEIDVLKGKADFFNINYAYFHTNIMCFGDSRTNIERYINLAFNEAGIKKKENTLSRKDIFLGSFPTGAQRFVQLKKNLMSFMTDLEACSFFNYEQNQEDLGNAMKGVRLCDNIYGVPFSVDIFDEPKKRGWIKNQNMVVFSGSGGGKSFTANHIFHSLYNQGAHIFCIDASYSYNLQTIHKNGVYLTFDNDNRISFNPFYIDWIDQKEVDHIFSSSFFVDEDNINMEEDIKINNSNFYNNLLTDKISVLQGLILAIFKNPGQTSSKTELNIINALLFDYFKEIHHRIKNGDTEAKKNMSFDDFYEFSKVFLPKYCEENRLTHVFDTDVFIHDLKQYCTGELYGYLLNSMDEKIQNLDKERFVVIDIQRIKENKSLFDIVSLLAMDLYNQKIAKLPMDTKKVLCVDEAWQAFAEEKMANFLKKQVKVVRKYGGLTVFISQEVDDFVNSPIIAESIINNSAIKLFADMGEFKAKFEPIKKLLSISDANEKRVLSLNQNLRNKNYRQICICWGTSQGQVFSVEVPSELRAIYETDADKVASINESVKKYGVEMAAINFANR